MMRRTMDVHILLIGMSAVTSAVLGLDADVLTRCPTGLQYTSAMKLFDDTCYQFVSEEKYWHQARDHCLVNGGRLVKIDDPETNQFIMHSLDQLWWKNKGVWIGLHDISSEMNWQWTGYELHENDAVLWTNWGRGHPGAILHSRRDCVRMVRNDEWKWHETFCNSLRWHYRFICQYKANSSRHQTSDRMLSARIHSPSSGSRVLERNNQEEQLRQNGETHGEAERQLNERGTRNDNEKNSHGNGILVSVVCVLVAALIAVGLFMYFRRRRRLRSQSDDSAESGSGIKGKDFDSGIIDAKDSIRTRAVANIYVDSDAKGHVTTRLTSKSEPVKNEDYADDDDEDDDDDKDGEERKPEADRNSSTTEATASHGVEFGYDTPKSKHVYAEILETNGDFKENDHIYEALEDIKN